MMESHTSHPQGKCAKMLPVSVVIRVIAESVATMLDAFPEPDVAEGDGEDALGRPSMLGRGEEEAKGERAAARGGGGPDPLYGHTRPPNKPVHTGGGVQMPRWGDTVILHAFTVFLRHVYLENDYDDGRDTRGAQDFGVDALLDELWALDNIMQVTRAAPGGERSEAAECRSEG